MRPARQGSERFEAKKLGPPRTGIVRTARTPDELNCQVCGSWEGLTFTGPLSGRGMSPLCGSCLAKRDRKWAEIPTCAAHVLKSCGICAGTVDPGSGITTSLDVTEAWSGRPMVRSEFCYVRSGSPWGGCLYPFGHAGAHSDDYHRACMAAVGFFALLMDARYTGSDELAEDRAEEERAMAPAAPTADVRSAIGAPADG